MTRLKCSSMYIIVLCGKDCVEIVLDAQSLLKNQKVVLLLVLREHWQYGFLMNFGTFWGSRFHSCYIDSSSNLKEFLFTLFFLFIIYYFFWKNKFYEVTYRARTSKLRQKSNRWRSCQCPARRQKWAILWSKSGLAFWPVIRMQIKLKMLFLSERLPKM